MTDISLYLHCRFWITSDVSIYLTSLNVSHFRNSNAQTPITLLFINENVKCGYSFSKSERKKQCGIKIICVFKNVCFLHFHRLPCELENACVLYKIKKNAFFSGEYRINFIL